MRGGQAGRVGRLSGGQRGRSAGQPGGQLGGFDHRSARLADVARAGPVQRHVGVGGGVQRGVASGRRVFAQDGDIGAGVEVDALRGSEDTGLQLGWDRVAALYAERARALGARPPRAAQPDRVLEGAPAVLATPAWRGEDDLPALLAAWADAPSGACLYLLADPLTDGEPAELEGRVLAAAQGIDLDACADIAILREHATPGRDAALHAAADAYVPLHRACAGHIRQARGAVIEPAELATWLASRPAALAA